MSERDSPFVDCDESSRVPAGRRTNMDKAKDAVDYILADHEELRRAFQRLTEAKESDREEIVQNVGLLIRAHSHAEEQHVYPALEVADEDERAEVEHGAEEHHEAEAILEQLESCPTDSSEFEVLRDQLVESVMHHMQEEEETTLPALRQSIDGETLVEMGRAFEEQRLAELSAG